MRSRPAMMAAIRFVVMPLPAAHMAHRYAEVIPEPDVVMLGDDIGHWPQLEAPDAVLTHFLAHIDGIAAR